MRLLHPLSTSTWRAGLIVSALLALIMASLPQPVPALAGINDKLQHIVTFMALGCLAVRAFPSRPFWPSALGLLVFGSAIEIIQLIPALHRESSPLDLLADAVGIILGYVVAILILRTR